MLPYPVLAELIEGILFDGRSEEEAAELREALSPTPPDPDENLAGVTVDADDFSFRARRVRRAKAQAMIDAGRLSGNRARLRLAVADARSKEDEARIDQRMRAVFEAEVAARAGGG